MTQISSHSNQGNNMSEQDLINSIDWKKGKGLIPAVIQDVTTKRVLMLGYMNQEALQITQETNKVTFYSRVKKRLWQKGETSGHNLDVISMVLDCDQDTLLVSVKPNGPVCHNGTETCFASEVGSVTKAVDYSFLGELEQIIIDRKNQPTDYSYTSRLFTDGVSRVAQKVGEEAVETVIAAMGENDTMLISEAADLVYHLLVLLVEKDVALKDVVDELESRRS